MPFAMAKPWRHPYSGILYLRQRTPSDLAGKLKGTTVTLPDGEEFVTVRVGATI